MYKPYLSRQKSGKSVQTTASAGDKTTLKLVTHQLRASQKVLNKSDQFIPSSLPVMRVQAAQSASPVPPDQSEEKNPGQLHSFTATAPDRLASLAQPSSQSARPGQLVSQAKGWTGQCIQPWPGGEDVGQLGRIGLNVL